ncbi:MBL fold metallo-hydrolase [bacterium]|nr:MAG: MBL fold metallo-hydrolase [bacterium]
MIEELTLHAHSTALFSTWILLEELRLLLDCGDGVMAGLGHKSRKVRLVAMSHGDRDHVMGLPQFLHHNALHGLAGVLYPKDSYTFPAMKAFSESFDPHTKAVVPWIGLVDGEDWELQRGMVVRAMVNTHIPGARARSMGWQVVRQFRKLRPELTGTPGPEIARLRKEGGDDAVTQPFEETLITFSGDTGEMEASIYGSPRLLIHEATFLSPDDLEEERPGHRHSCLPAVLQLAKEIAPEKLVLTHFSSRYPIEQIRTAVASGCAELAISFPVWIVPPMRTAWDLLRQTPVYAPVSE